MIELEITLLVLAGAVALDLVVGDPRRVHPTVWIGRLITVLMPRLKHASAGVERARGTVVAIGTVALAAASAYYLIHSLQLLGIIALVVGSVLVLKSSIAIRSMENHARTVMDALAAHDIAGARSSLAKIVGRDTSQLDEQHIISATIESVGESTVDGITAPLFYYALFGVPGAFAYRTINTLDSMLGYKDAYHRHIGLFSAKLDTVANYIPARITAMLMVVAASMIGADWKNSLQVMLRDKRKTPSVNSGWPMSSVAGALRVRLEKTGYYSLGEGYEHLTLQHCGKAISMMKITTLLFIAAFTIPAITLLSLLGWW